MRCWRHVCPAGGGGGGGGIRGLGGGVWGCEQVATFYTMFNKQRVGKYFIQLCGTTPCMVCGSEEIKKTIETELGIHDGGAWPVEVVLRLGW
jgi:hypothetical protein